MRIEWLRWVIYKELTPIPIVHSLFDAGSSNRKKDRDEPAGRPHRQSRWLSFSLSLSLCPSTHVKTTPSHHRHPSNWSRFYNVPDHDFLSPVVHALLSKTLSPFRAPQSRKFFLFSIRLSFFLLFLMHCWSIPSIPIDDSFTMSSLGIVWLASFIENRGLVFDVPLWPSPPPTHPKFNVDA